MAASSASSSQVYSHSKPPVLPKDKDTKPPPRKLPLDEATGEELRRKKLCFNYKGSWEPGHKCLRKGNIYDIEVVSDDDDEQEDIPSEDSQPHEDTKLVSLNHTERIAALVGCGGTIALAGSSRCTVFHVWRIHQGQRVIVMLDIEATLNFINSSLVKRRGLHMETHAGF